MARINSKIVPPQYIADCSGVLCTFRHSWFNHIHQKLHNILFIISHLYNVFVYLSIAAYSMPFIINLILGTHTLWHCAKRRKRERSKRERAQISNNNDRIDNWRQIERNANKREKIIIYDNQWFLAVFNAQLMAFVKMNMVRLAVLLFMESYFCVFTSCVWRYSDWIDPVISCWCCCCRRIHNCCVARHRLFPHGMYFFTLWNVYQCLDSNIPIMILGYQILLNW